MNTFVSAVDNQMTTTTNDMVAHLKTGSGCVDLFYKSGAMRGQNIIPVFVGALVENKELALRIAQWLRDVRCGAGERQLFRDILQYLEVNDGQSCEKLLYKIPELGRYDDLFAVQTPYMRNIAFAILKSALYANDGLAYKYCPREHSANKKDYVDFRNYLALSPKEYRKFIVAGSHTTEQYMCAKKFNEINFSHVPSVCHARNKKAFNRNAPVEYAEYVKGLATGETKINAGAVYPYDVLRGRISAWGTPLAFDATELEVITQQWNALPNYIGDFPVIPLVDVSGSMTCSVGGNSKSNLTCLEIAVSLGLYCADKNAGVFKDMFLTFSMVPQLLHLKGNINEKIDQMVKSHWAMNTNLESALLTILRVAKEGNVSPEQMPKMLLILSDMQFDEAVDSRHTALAMIKSRYSDSGYDIPVIVFWNLHSFDNCSAKFNDSGVALISGFSPAILESVLKNDLDQISPEKIMLTTVMVDRYNI
jgi:hypothetical protein